ncbi:hypothetical protein ACWPKO_00895 [Coraliomargarita sp. W4R53]
MKTILYVHILIRLFASACILFGLYQLAARWPAFLAFQQMLARNKEESVISGQVAELSPFMPRLMDIMLSPILLVIFGLIIFLATKIIVQCIIGRQQIEALLACDRKET